MAPSIISWFELEHYTCIRFHDNRLTISLETFLVCVDAEKITLQTTDFVYSIAIYQDDWADGQFNFYKYAK